MRGSGWLWAPLALILLGSAAACTAPNPAFVRAPVAVPDANAGDAAREAAASDLAAEDLAAPDLAVSDLAAPDLATDGTNDVPLLPDVASGEEDAGPDVGGEAGPALDFSGPPAPDASPVDGGVAPADTAALDGAPSGDDAAAMLRRGLVGYWALDEGTGIVARDQASLGNDGELRGGTGWAGAGFPARFSNPGCLSLDGLDDEVHVAVAGLPDIGAAKSITLWVWFAQPLPASVRKNLVAFSAFADNVGIQLGFDSGRTALWLRGENTTLVVADVLSPQTWHHVAYVFDGTLHQIFVDGAFASSSSRARHVGPATSLWFGSYGGNTQHFGGRMDDIRFYDRTLTSDEVLALFQGR